MVDFLGVKMVLEWREHDQRDLDQEALHDVPTVNFLRSSGLLKLFCTSPMRANVHVIEFMINYWDHDMGMFDLQGETLEITSDDIYFIASLSQRGSPINLEGTGRGGDPLSVQNYIDVYCAPGTQKRGSCIPIAHIRDISLQVLTSTIVRIAGSYLLHLATWNQMSCRWIICRVPYMIGVQELSPF